MTTAREQIKELQAQIESLRAQEKREKDELAKTVEIQHRWTLEWDRNPRQDIWDNDVCIYQLNAVVTNREECEAVGRDLKSQEGGMHYFYNQATGKLICDTGGGRVWISTRRWRSGGTEESKERADRSAVKCIEALNQFINDNPEGGDVTHIIGEHQREVYGR